MENKTENTESKIVKNLIDNLRQGTSFLQTPNKDPDYVVNYASKKTYDGVNFLIVGQGMKDAGKTANLAMSNRQGEELGLWIEKGKKSIGTALYDIAEAYYNKNDKEVIDGKKKAGEHKVDADGKFVKDTNFSFVFAAEDFVKTTFQAERDENNNVLHYEKDEPMIDPKTKEPVLHQKDGVYTDKDGKEFPFKKGDVVIAHRAGSVIGKMVGTDEHVVNKEKNHLPPLVDAQTIAPAYKRKDNSGKEIFIEKMSEAIRGKALGNFDGLKITKDEIDAIEKEFLNHERKFRGTIKTAWTRAIGSKEDVAKMEQAILAKENKNTNENTEEVKKTKGRK